ncbi:PD40 domain-containing protein [candidate division KSB1 bacterium]|nr:PD40 domain-containing protein [candidate division KSB1 bacterium]
MKCKTLPLILLVFLALLQATNIHAQYYFGRNKIQYNQFDWHVLETEHFDIYYYPEMRELAEIGAAYAEETYSFLENKFNHNVLRRIPLIFYATHAHFQETNTIPYLIPEGVGGFFEFIKGRVVVPANGSIPDFKHVLRHELVHVFTTSLEQEILKRHRLANHPGLPLWFIEGLAEYWSTGWDSQAEMFIRDATLNGYLYPLNMIYQITGSFLMYKEGQAALKYIAETYGEDKIVKLIENLWMANDFSDVFRITLGVDYKQFDRDWIYHLRKQHFPLLKDHDSARMATEQLTYRGINIKPAFYGNGNSPSIVFLSTRTGYANICLAPIQPGEKEARVEILVAGERSADFESFHLLSNKIDVHPQGRLAFTSKSGEQDYLYIYDLERKAIVGEYAFANLVSIFSPTWSPDGSRIAFTGLAFSGQSDLFVYNLESDSLHQVTDDYFDDKDPNWSPDGQFVAFSSDRGAFGRSGYYNIYAWEPSFGRLHALTNGDFNDTAPAWSPDGQNLAFSSDRNGTANIWVLHPGGRSRSSSDLISVPTPKVEEQKSSPTIGHPLSVLNSNRTLKQITHFTTGAFDPEWNDDQTLLFSGFENLSYQIFLITGIEDLIREAVPIDSLDSPLLASYWDYDKLGGGETARAVRYKSKYDLDIAQSQITQDPIFGTSGGAQLAISDMLGNYQYYFLIYNTARTRDEFLESFNLALTRVDLSKRTNLSYGLYHFAGRFYNRYDYWFWERRYGGYGAVSYPLSKFKRVEASLNIRHSDKEWFIRDHRRKALLISAFGSYIKDTSLWGPTGPIDGERINLTLGNTYDVAYSHVNFFTVIADYRRYIRLSPRISHAVRLWTQMNYGKETTPFFMGGSWDLRGYGLWRIWGKKIALVSNELRFPFIDHLAVNFPFGGLGLNAVRGALFLDVGNAWDQRFEGVLGSTGFGVRFRFGGMLVLRFDMGRRFYLNDVSNFYQLGRYDFDDKWFTQFFFGWDF